VGLDSSILEQAFHKLASNVAILVRPAKLEDACQVDPDSVRSLLHEIRGLFPFTVVDVPRSFDRVTAAALSDSDRILVVTQLSVAAIRNATRIYDWLRQVGAPEHSIGIVVNRATSNHGHITTQDVESHFNKPIFAVVPNDYRRMQVSMDIGYSLAKDDSQNPVQAAIRDMARRIGGDLLAADEPAPKSAGTLLGRLWRRRSHETVAARA
jgi:pilus assembly protein CpaE